MKKEYASYRAVMLDTLGRFRVTSLFWETRRENEVDYPPIFTVKPRPHTVNGITYPSLKAIYMSYDHIPYFEYEFALDVFGSWEHWVKLTNSTMEDLFQGWRDELTIKLKSFALKKIIKQAREDSVAGLKATQYLADEGYVPKKVGRISKIEKERQVKIAAGVRDTLQNDIKRLGLDVIDVSKSGSLTGENNANKTH